jgi:hypothetical protein
LKEQLTLTQVGDLTMSEKFESFEAFRQGGFFNWITSFQTAGGAGKLQFTENRVSWKTAFLNMAGKFDYKLDELVSVEKAKYLNFWVFPSQCFKFTFKDGKSFRFTFCFSGGKGKQDDKVKELLVSKGVAVNF